MCKSLKIIVGIFFLASTYPVVAHAACSGSSPNWTASSPALTDVASCAAMYACNDQSPGVCTSINQSPNPCTWGGTCQPALMMCSDGSGQCAPGNGHPTPGSSCGNGGTCTAYYNPNLQAGDTVTVPSGSATWTGVNLLLAHGITVRSAGTPSSNPTTITLASGLIGWAGGYAGLSTLQGFTIDETGGTIYLAANAASGAMAASASYPIRITQNAITVANSGDAIILGEYGLIDRNTFNLNAPASVALYSVGDGATVEGLYKEIGWGQLWSSNVEWNIVEGNTFNGTVGYRAGNSPVPYDSNGGANKIVLRYNTLTNMDQFVAHGTSWSGANNPGAYAAEIYNNLWIYQNGYTMRALTDIMGGTVLMHDNVLQKWGTGSPGAEACSGYNDGTWNWTCPHNWQDVRTTSVDGNTMGWLQAVASNAPIKWCSTTSGGIPTPSQWVTCNSVHNSCASLVGTGSTCSVMKCLGGTNAGSLCLSNSDCTGGGTCTGYFDNDTLSSGRIAFNGTGAGGINSTTGLNDSAPMYFWNNWQYSCAADGTGCTKAARVEITAPTMNISVNTLVGRDYFNETPNVTIDGSSINYTPAACPNPLTGLSGSCNSTEYGTAGYPSAAAIPAPGGLHLTQ
jgi:hypothetical protein